MSGPPLPACEGERLAYMNSLGILDTPPDPELHNILTVLCNIFGTSSALIALFGDRRIWIKQAANFQEGTFPWYQSFCGWTLSSAVAQPMVISDARTDARFCSHPYVRSGAVLFYMGTPLVSKNGHRLGTLCCTDPSPREFDGRQALMMTHFGELVTKQIENSLRLSALRRGRGKQEKGRWGGPAGAHGPGEGGAAGTAAAGSVASSGSGSVCFLCVETGQGEEWPVVHATQEMAEVAGVPTEAMLGLRLWDLFEADAARQGARAVAARGEPFQLMGARLVCGVGRGGGGPRAPSFDLTFLPASSQVPLERDSPPVALPTYLPEPRDPDKADTLYFVTARISSAGAGGATSESSCAGAGGPWPDGMLQLASFSNSPPSAGSGADSAARAAAAAAGAPPGGGGSGGSSAAPSSVGFSSVLQSSASFTGPSWAGGGGGGSGRGAQRAAAKEVLPGLKLGPAIAAGSYGRVYKGTYWGTRVAVKILDAPSVKKRDPETGASLEAVLSRSLAHPNVVRTLEWRLVSGKMRVHQQPIRLLGESLPELEKPTKLMELRRQQQAELQERQEQERKQQQQEQQQEAPACGPQGFRADHNGRQGAPMNAATRAPQDAPPAPLAGVDQLNGSADSAGADGEDGEEQEDEEEEEGGPEGESQNWIVLEYCDKGCLQDAVDRGWLAKGLSPESAGRVNLAAVLATAREIASGMSYLHARGVLHGDLSAFNVMLSTQGADRELGARGFVAKVADFGLSRVLEDHKSRIETQTYGTITAMAPEVLRDGVISRAADVYSWGVLLWQMCGGGRPWAGMGHAAVIRAVCGERRQLKFAGETPEPIQAMGLACMAHDPEERPTFADVLEVLEPLAEAIAAA